MLKYRLLFGTLMTVFFTAIAILDGWLDGSVTASVADDKAVQGTILCILVALLIIKAQFEFSRLAAAKNLRVFTPVSAVTSVLVASTWYWPQVIDIPAQIYVLVVLGISLAGLLLYQYMHCGTSDVIGNCGANYFCIIYLGLLSCFVVAVRIDFGLWPLLMFIFAVKCSDIGAYAIGSLFGKRKFSPRISPGKTWEGMAGAAVAAMIVAIVFAVSFAIMEWQVAVIFGLCIAFLGQLGDLVESMMKRDAERKDSGSDVPGFGGVLDIIDSPLLTAPFAYLFFALVRGLH